MKRLISIIFACLLLFTGCSKEENYIFFSSDPILEKTFDFNRIEKTFKKGQKIHYVVVKNTEFQSKKIRVQIIKQSDKVEILGYELVYGNDFEVEPQKQFFLNDVCIHSKGFFIFRVFDFADLKKPYAQSYFWIQE